VLLGGCSGGSPGPAGRRTPADERARARAARDSRGLAAHYDAVIAAHPGLGERLAPLRGEVARHADVFESGEGGGGRRPPGGAGGATAGVPAPGLPSPSPRTSYTAPRVAVPGDEKDALAQLAAAERVLVERRSRALLDVPGEAARLFASVAAAGAAHVYLLTEGDR
jgi:hypothetical protein